MYGWSGGLGDDPVGVTAAPLSPLWYQQIADLAKIPGIVIKSDPVPVPVPAPAPTPVYTAPAVVPVIVPAPSLFDSIPWWGWLAGAGAGLYLLRGRK